jgi:hypothetical protein
VIPAEGDQQGDSGMMGRQDRDQRQLFYEFSLDEVIPPDHLLRASTHWQIVDSSYHCGSL